MRDRNPYASTPVDFSALAVAYPALKPRLFFDSNGAPTLNFKDITSQRLLTEALLHRDFGLSLVLPLDRLCPPVPNRLEYVLWIQDIVAATTEDDGASVTGLDVGTGASSIYPLLACRMRDNWHMIASEVDQTSIKYAEENVCRNGLSDRIKLLRATPSGHVLSPIFDSPQTQFNFMMCNPPFYASKDDLLSSAEAKVLEPHAVCTGAEVEMITEGGEVEFVGRIVEDSVLLRDRCRWYTSLLGKSSSVTAIVELLRSHQLDNYGVTGFDVGKTKRWAVAWSYGTIRLPDKLARISKPQLASVMPARNEIQVSLRSSIRLPDVEGLLVDVLASLAAVTYSRAPASPSADEPRGSVCVDARVNSWTRSFRRQGQHHPIDTEVPPIIRCRISWWPDVASEQVIAQCGWVEGRDRRLFESFWSHVSRKAFNPTQ